MQVAVALVGTVLKLGQRVMAVGCISQMANLMLITKYRTYSWTLTSWTVDAGGRYMRVVIGIAFTELYMYTMMYLNDLCALH